MGRRAAVNAANDGENPDTEQLMGADYYVALRNASWPTMQALQECIDRRGWPVKLGGIDNPRWLEFFDKATPNAAGFPVEFKGRPIELEANFVTLSPTKGFACEFSLSNSQTNEGEASAHQHQDTLKPADINAILSKIGATGVHFDYGDRVITITFRSDTKKWQAGFYVMAALISCFDGYGFELQGGAHGKQSSTPTC